MRDDGVRFALVAFPPVRVGMKPTVMSISEDAVPAALARHWLVLARDSDVLGSEPWAPHGGAQERTT